MVGGARAWRSLAVFDSRHRKECQPKPRRVVGGGSDLQLTSTTQRTSAVWASTKIKLPIRIRACGVVTAKSGGSLMTLGSAIQSCSLGPPYVWAVTTSQQGTRFIRTAA